MVHLSIKERGETKRGSCGRENRNGREEEKEEVRGKKDKEKGKEEDQEKGERKREKKRGTQRKRKKKGTKQTLFYKRRREVRGRGLLLTKVVCRENKGRAPTTLMLSWNSKSF